MSNGTTGSRTTGLRSYGPGICATSARRDDETAGRPRTWVRGPWAPSRLLQPAAASSHGLHGSRFPLFVASWLTSDLCLLSSVFRSKTRVFQAYPGQTRPSFPPPPPPIHPLAAAPFRPISVSPIRPSPFPVGNPFCVSLRGRVSWGEQAWPALSPSSRTGSRRGSFRW